MKVLSLNQIKQRINIQDMLRDQEEGFELYSKGLVNMPMPGYLEQDQPKGSYHIKYGAITGGSFWVVKIAGGPEHLPINGIMLAICTKTGQAKYILQDEGYLTALRTAIAGLICAKHFACKNLDAIGVIGTGLQARLQVELLAHLTDCKKIFVCGRSEDSLSSYQKDMVKKGYDVVTSQDASFVSRKSRLIITTTASRSTILKAQDIKPGTHITAVGADSPGKMELDPKLLAKSDLIVVDSKEQCIDHGEVSYAYKQGLIQDNQLIELGSIISNPSLGRSNNNQITISDLTGLAVQDIQIVKSILNKDI